jgi:hypothetical protein
LPKSNIYNHHLKSNVPISYAIQLSDINFCAKNVCKLLKQIRYLYWCCESLCSYINKNLSVSSFLFKRAGESQSSMTKIKTSKYEHYLLPCKHPKSFQFQSKYGETYLLWLSRLSTKTVIDYKLHQSASRIQFSSLFDVRLHIALLTPYEDWQLKLSHNESIIITTCQILVVFLAMKNLTHIM